MNDQIALEDVQHFGETAYRHTPGNGPLIVFLPGYQSDMAGSKATAVFDWARRVKRGCLLFDYSGCGLSGGDFADGTLSRWRDELLALIDHVHPAGPIHLVGSSMGGWLMFLTAAALGDRVTALVGIAAAPDFTNWGYDDEQKARFAAGGTVLQHNPYGAEPLPTYAGFWRDGQSHLIARDEIAFAGRVRLIQGMQDSEVPWRLAPRIAERLRSDDVQVRLIKDGDHRLSREGDIALLIETIAAL